MGIDIIWGVLFQKFFVSHACVVTRARYVAVVEIISISIFVHNWFNFWTLYNKMKAANTDLKTNMNPYIFTLFTKRDFYAKI